MIKQPEKIFLASDYQEGAHPAILEALCRTNMEKTDGYGTDPYCDSARNLIRRACHSPSADVHFFMGGTQTNAVVISALLKPWQGAVAAVSGHISLHEGGAIESAGHKVIELPAVNGKLSSPVVEECCAAWHNDGNHEHMVMPGLLYLSQPTESGTLYSLKELKDLKEVCRRFGLLLYIDGARLAYALSCPENDVTLSDLAALCDAFYIGGTKCGALFGEAVVFPDPELCPHFFTIMKQRGAVLAKGRLLGLQYKTLFETGPDGTVLYDTIGKSAVELADRLRNGLSAKGFKLCFNSPTNQVFVSIENKKMKELSEKVVFSYWEADGPDHTVIRFACSWATTQEDVDAVLSLL